MTPTVATKPEKTTYVFAARATDLLVCIVGDRRVWHNESESEIVRGKWAQFEHGRLDVDDRVARRVGFESAEEMAEKLRRHDQFGSEFVELQIEPPAPSPEDDLAEVMRLLAAQDIDGLTEVYVQERANFNRPTVLKAVESALLALEGRDPHEATREVELDGEPQEPHAEDPQPVQPPAEEEDVDQSHLQGGPSRAAGLFQRTE